MDSMTAGQRLRATYNFQPVDHLIRTEFYIWEEAIAKWKDQGLPDDWAQTNLFNYESTGYFSTGVKPWMVRTGIPPAFRAEGFGIN